MQEGGNRQPGQPVAAAAAAAMLNRQTPTAGKKTILSIDLGRTSTKASTSRNPNEVVFIPSNIKALTGDTARGGGFEYQGMGYAVGQLAADFGASLFKDGSDSPSKVDDALIKLFACIGYFKLQGDIDVVLGLPFYSQSQFEQEKEHITRLLCGTHDMLYRGEKVSVNVNTVRIMPEGYGSLIWLEAQGGQGVPNFADLSVAIVDVGHQTTDFLTVDRFRFARGVSKSETFAMGKFYEEVASKIEGADSQSLYLLEAVHKPAGERLYRPRGAVQPFNLDDIVPELRQKFARDLCDLVVKWLPERVTDVVVTGGGGEFFWEDLQPLLKKAGLKAYLVQPSRKANALGQYVYGEAQLARR
jgi:plasmid segregation protein ParM